MMTLKAAVNAKATPNQLAALEADIWCRRNSGWQRICDLSSELIKTKAVKRLHELDSETQHTWESRFGSDAAVAWSTLGPAEYKVAVGYILDDGRFVNLDEFHAQGLASHGFMMVLQVGAKNATCRAESASPLPLLTERDPATRR